MLKKLVQSFLMLVVGLSSLAASKDELVIFHAGSLSVPFQQMVEEFKKNYPDTIVKKESAGSVACARKITDLKQPCDVLAVADYTVIETFLIPDYAGWCIKFAANEMIIAYTDKSTYRDKISSLNWYDILLKKDVFIGRADPNSDPCGYRTVQTMKLAELFYKKPGLADKLISKDQNFIRPKEVDLLALLEAHAIDYLFIYKSVALQHGLKYLVLPDEINLKSADKKEIYAKATVEINGKKPGEKETQVGIPMVYGLTIPKNSPNPDLALKFVDFVLSKEGGSKIMLKNGQPSVIPAYTDTYRFLPETLKKYAKTR